MPTCSVPIIRVHLGLYNGMFLSTSAWKITLSSAPMFILFRFPFTQPMVSKHTPCLICQNLKENNSIRVCATICEWPLYTPIDAERMDPLPFWEKLSNTVFPSHEKHGVTTDDVCSNLDRVNLQSSLYSAPDFTTWIICLRDFSLLSIVRSLLTYFP